MAEAEVQRHVDAWIFFTKLLKWSIGFLIVLLILLATFLLPH
jgi:hypothetical protein